MRNLSFILSIPRSLIVCLIVFPFKEAIKLPVLISNRTHIMEIHRGSIKIDKDYLKLGAFRFGFSGTEGIMPDYKRSILEITKSGTVYLHGRAAFAEQSALRVSGELHIGNEAIFNTRFMLSCNNKVTIGNHFMGAWGVHIQDSNNHYILYDGVLSEDDHEIEIGDHVWFCAEASMLNGKVSDGSVVAYKTVITKKFDKSNVLIAGYPAKIIKENIRWIHDKGEL